MKAPARITSAAQWMSPMPGRMAMATPRKPSAIAPQRCGPTRSPRSGMLSAATKNGAEKPMVVTSTIWRWRSEKKVAPVIASRQSERKIWSPGRFVATSRRP